MIFILPDDPSLTYMASSLTYPSDDFISFTIISFAASGLTVIFDEALPFSSVIIVSSRVFPLYMPYSAPLRE